MCEMTPEEILAFGWIVCSLQPFLSLTFRGVITEFSRTYRECDWLFSCLWTRPIFQIFHGCDISDCSGWIRHFWTISSLSLQWESMAFSSSQIQNGQQDINLSTLSLTHMEQKSFSPFFIVCVCMRVCELFRQLCPSSSLLTGLNMWTPQQVIEHDVWWWILSGLLPILPWL